MLLASCKTESVSYSTTPVISLKSLTTLKSISGNDSLIEIIINYEDGDGNIGLSETDTAPPFNYGGMFYHNLPIKYMVKNNGVFEEVKNPDNQELYGNQHERIPHLTAENASKAISGTIKVTLTTNPFDIYPDEVQFEIKLIDRELNISNSITTQSLQLVH